MIMHGVLRHILQYFSYIVVVSFIGGGNRITWRKPQLSFEKTIIYVSLYIVDICTCIYIHQLLYCRLEYLWYLATNLSGMRLSIVIQIFWWIQPFYHTLKPLFML